MWIRWEGSAVGTFRFAMLETERRVCAQPGRARTLKVWSAGGAAKSATQASWSRRFRGGSPLRYAASGCSGSCGQRHLAKPQGGGKRVCSDPSREMQRESVRRHLQVHAPRSAIRKTISKSCLGRGTRKDVRLPPTVFLRACEDLDARRASGTRCSRPILHAAAGMVQQLPASKVQSRSTSPLHFTRCG
jgi:hypothetical protein